MIPLRMVKLERNANVAVFPSGLSIKLYEPAYPGQQVRVSATRPPTPRRWSTPPTTWRR